jgi:hypothetical protein
MIGYLSHPLPYRLPIQSRNLSHARDPSMPELLSLKGSEQPALAGIHQAHDQVYLMVEGFIRVFEHALTDRTDTVIGV